MKIKLAGIVFFSLCLGMLSSTVLAADKVQAEKAVATAETAQKKAASVGGEWRDTGKIIKQAKSAQSKGDFDQAIKLANKATRQGQLGYEQAVAQSELRIPSYFK